MNPIKLTTEDGSRTVWACGECGTFVPPGSEEAAERCCTCRHCGATLEEVNRAWGACQSCRSAAERERRETRRQHRLSLPVAEDHDGPVYVEDFERFYHDQQSARDDLLDHGMDLADAAVLPCVVATCPTPDLLEHVYERWSEEFDPDHSDDVYDNRDREVVEAIAAAQKVAEQHAPTVWKPDYTRRVDFAVSATYQPTGDTDE